MAPSAPLRLRLFDTRRGAVVPFAPLGDPIGLYVCGVTPYDTTHLGHAFTYLVFDVLHRYLEYLGHPVRYVQNLTDVDDDLLGHARQVGEDYLVLGQRHTDRFLADMAALNWLPPDVKPRATEHIPEMVAMTQRLLARGLAYAADGHVYLSVAADPGFGSLSHLPPAERLATANERGNDPGLPGKRDPLDAVLWQPSAPDEPAWPSPFGPGRPGWHIECSAMSVTHLGPRFDIHGGGRDLAFPHHEFERIQSEAATGQGPVVGLWIHTGMVLSGRDKMSKSLGNLVLVGDLLARWPADVVRLALLNHPYRADLPWTKGRLGDAVVLVERWTGAVTRTTEVDEAAGGPTVRRLRDSALASLDNDLDLPSFVRALDDLADLAIHRRGPEGHRASTELRELATRIGGLRLGSEASP